MTEVSPGRAAYEAYDAHLGPIDDPGYVGPNTVPLTLWEEVREPERRAWEAAAKAGHHAVERRTPSVTGYGPRADAVRLEVDRDEARAERDSAYRERARLVAFLAACYPAVMLTDDAGPDWPIVFVEAPAGQMSWHIARADLGLFAHVPATTEPTWDGHTTEEKYQRLAEMTDRMHRAGGITGAAVATPAARAIGRLVAAGADDGCPCHGDTKSTIHGTCCDPGEPADASSLAEHARREMELSGQYAEDPGYSESIISAVKAFASYGHSGGSAMIAREQLHALLGWKALSPLTSDPAEWVDHSGISGSPLWQNRRDPSVFSKNGGATWYSISDPEGEPEPDPAERLLAFPLPPNDSGASTLGGYFAALLTKLWSEPERFDGAAPFGDEAWRADDIYGPMIHAGLIQGEFAEADALILAAIAKMGEHAVMISPVQAQTVGSDGPGEAAIAERLRIAAILDDCLPSGADALTPAILKALVAFWDTWWNKTATLESDIPGHSLMTYEDVTALSQAAEAVEELLFAPVDDAEDDQRLALAALDFGGCDPASALSHAVAALADSNEGVRLWMLDCGNLVQKHREHAVVASLRLGEIRAILLDGDHDDATARSLALAALARPEVTP